MAKEGSGNINSFPTPSPLTLTNYLYHQAAYNLINTLALKG